MRSIRFAAMAVTALCLAPPVAFSASPRETITPAFKEAIPDMPGKSLVAAVVSYPPGGKTPSHHHAASAFITAYVLSGAIRSQIDGEPAHVFHAGESWSEQPGAHHVVSENASATKPAKLLAIFVVDSGDTALTVFDGQ